MLDFESCPTFCGSLTFVEFCVQVIFSGTIRSRAIKLGSCIHLEE